MKGITSWQSINEQSQHNHLLSDEQTNFSLL